MGLSDQHAEYELVSCVLSDSYLVCNSVLLQMVVLYQCTSNKIFQRIREMSTVIIHVPYQVPLLASQIGPKNVFLSGLSHKAVLC